MTTERKTGRIGEGTRLWEPSEERKSQANLTRYLEWLEKRKGLAFDSYQELWRWSVSDLEAFWGSIWDYFKVQAHQPYRQVLSTRTMPGADWFTGARLNYAEHALRRRDQHPAVVAAGEDRPLATLSYGELYRQTASVAAGLRDLGVGKGDRVVAVLPNIPEALVAFLATASLGAVWSSCPPEFGTRSIVERFGQIEPRDPDRRRRLPLQGKAAPLQGVRPGNTERDSIAGNHHRDPSSGDGSPGGQDP